MELRVESTRGGLVESVHRVSAAVVDQAGRLRAAVGDPTLVTFWRSAAKPFQAIPCVADGAAARFEFDDRELALACASHSSEPVHLEVAEGMLRKIGLPEQALACGPHVPLSPAVARQVTRGGIEMTPKWSNCSGKHAAMLALALHHGWPTPGYERREHRLQLRLRDEVARWTGLDAHGIALGVDGCTATAFALPLQAMALAYARFGVSGDLAARTLRQAMATHPILIAGRDRVCTDLSAATQGAILAKVGADGIHCAAVPQAGLGIALKVEDGDMASSPVALLALLAQVEARLGLPVSLADPPLSVKRHMALPTVNTRGQEIGVLRAAGEVRFCE